jgi:hypothetical protein
MGSPAAERVAALWEYVTDVQSGSYPAEKQVVTMAEELERFSGSLRRFIPDIRSTSSLDSQ